MHTVTSADGTTIAYDRTGAGEPVVLVAGAFSYRRYPGQVKLAELLSGRSQDGAVECGVPGPAGGPPRATPCFSPCRINWASNTAHT